MLLATLALLVGSSASSGCIHQTLNPDGEYECQHGGVCTQFGTFLSSGFICDCPRGTLGRACGYCDRSFLLINDRCVNPSCVLDGVSVCGDGGECVYTEDTDSWSCSCGTGFVDLAGTCIASACIDPAAPTKVCNDYGSCKRLPGGVTGEDYTCECDKLHQGDLCDTCNRRMSKPVTTDGVTECVSMDCFNGDDELPCGGTGRCVGYPTENGMSYVCMCPIGYSLVDKVCVPLGCVFEYSDGHHVCGYDDSFKTACVKDSQGAGSCNCPTGTTLMDGYGCVSSQCIDSGDTVPCGGVGGCYVYQIGTSSTTYKCMCPHYTAGTYCKTCAPDEATEIDGVCVPNDCVYGGTSCNGHGVCHTVLVHSFCECEADFSIVDEGRHYCGIPECHDPNTEMLCSGAGVCDEQARVCACLDGFQYQTYGGCVPDKLITDGQICNGRGVAVLKDPWDLPANTRLNATNPDHWTCRCSALYAGDTCSTCNPLKAFTATSTSSPSSSSVGASLPTCTPRDCYADGYEKKTPADPSSPYKDQPTKLCTNPLQTDNTALGTCQTYPVGEEQLFICESTNANMYQQAYNSSSIYPIACTMPGQFYVHRNFMCGFLESKTGPFDLLRIGCTAATGGSYNCTCTGGYNWVKKTFGSLERYSCMHDDCLNNGAESGSSDYNDYCAGLGDCVIDTLDSSRHICVCGDGAVTVKGKCIPRACVSGWKDEISPIICGGRGVCTHWGDGEWGCKCMDIDHYTYVNGGCYPNACIYTWQNPSDGTAYIQLCGGDNHVPGGTCVVDEASPSDSYCECNEDFVKYDHTCVHKTCTSVDYHNDFQVTHDSICSGTGFCYFSSRTNTSHCLCTTGTAYGPFCSVESCVTTIDYEFGDLWGEIYLNCGRPGAGVCSITTTGGATTGTCSCNSDYEILPDISDKFCLNTGCIDNEVYCGGDLAAICSVSGDTPACLCSPAFMAVNDTCVPKECYAPKPDGTLAVCGGVGTCTKQADSSLYTCQCSQTGYTAAQMKYGGNTVWTCAPTSCVDGVGQTKKTPTVCGGTVGGSCVGSGGQYRCSCGDGFLLFTPTQCVSNSCLSQNSSGQVSICSGVGTCFENATSVSTSYYCASCGSNFKAIDGKCVSDSCSFAIGSSGKYYVCGKLGNFGECVGSGSGFTCACSRATFLYNGYCVPNQCTDNYRYLAECGGHGVCKFKTLGEFTCVCNENYETVDTDALGLHYCVAQACMVKSGNTITSICNGHGLCRNNACTCYPGYADESNASTDNPTGNCTVCASGYKEYPAPTSFAAIAGGARCVKNNCGQSTQADDCGGSAVANSPSCAYSSKSGTYECSCKTGYYADSGICKVSSCVGEGSTVECGGSIFGACDNTNKICVCASGMVLVKPYLCVSPRCISNSATNEVCNGQGTCTVSPLTRTPMCSCSDGYTTARDGLCYPSACFNDPEHTQPMVCDGAENTCTSGTCACAPPFVKLSGQNGCVHSDCIQNGLVCGGRGVCRANLLYTKFTCLCDSNYILATDGTCQPASCSRDGVTICDGNGSCELSADGTTYGCQCNTDSVSYANGCTPRACFPRNNPRYTLCGGYGQCDMSARVCQCNSGATLTDELLCQPASCVNPAYTETVCTNNGACSSTSNTCMCAEGSAGTYCESCAHGYRKHTSNDDYNGMCVKDSCGTKNCGIPGECIFDASQTEYRCSCNEGFYYSASEETCRRCFVENCVICNGDSSCAVCEDGYYSNKGRCRECDDDCRTCSGPEESQCLSCKPGKVHSTGTGSANCIDECRENSDGCATCGSVIAGSKYCSVCSGQSSFPLDGVCQAKSSRAAGDACEAVSAGRCTRCSNNYFLYEGGCYSTSRLPGSQVCSAALSGSCLKCAEGYYKGTASSGCVACDSLMDGCTKCTASGCTECEGGYYPDASSGKCVQCAGPCKTCNGAGSRCTSCAEGYFAQFMADGVKDYGECRSCSNTTADNGLVGVKNCKQCVVFAIGSPTLPEKVHCDEFSSGNKSSAGVIAGSVIAVLVLGGVAGFCVWWFLIRGKKGSQGSRGGRSSFSSKRKYARTVSDPDSTSLLSADMTTSLL